MKLQNFTVIFIIIILPIILLVSLYISTGLKTIKYQALYDTGLITATQDAIQAFEINTTNNTYSDNAEVKRSVIKSSIKMLEKGLCNTCNISSYNTDEIEEYIPAVLFGMNNGFYLYTPSLNPTTGSYEHSLKNYVYYSETLEGKNDGTEGVVIIYHLDSYVEVSGYFDGKYESQEGYLINVNETNFTWGGNSKNASQFYASYKNALKNNPYNLNGSITYYNTEIDIADELAVNYFVDNYKFSEWFNNTVYSNVNECNWLKVDEKNDPEDPESIFSMHKKEVIRKKIQNVLNSSITAYSERTYGQEYKMPKLSEEDWEKIYTDISVITFFQGKKIGFTKYNGYCVLNSNNHNELINPNLLYFSTDDDSDKEINTTDDYYHDIRCSELSEISEIEIKQDDRASFKTIRGWKIGRFQRKTITQTDEETGEATYSHTYERKECACYECINGPVSNSGISIYDYINVATSSISEEGHAKALVTSSYWTSLARERAKLHEDKEIPTDITVTKTVEGIGKDSDGTPYVMNGGKATYTITIKNNADKIEYITIEDACTNISDKINDKRIIEVKKDDATITDITKITEINPKEKITITYTANIVDGNNDQKVENHVEILTDGGVKVEDTATCNVYTSKLTIDKKIQNPKEFYEPGEDIKYIITIENDGYIDDKINIKDIYYDNELEIISCNYDYARPSNGSGEDGFDGNKSKEWSNIQIGRGNKITITIDAKLKGNIGKTITNTAIVQSTLTGATSWAKASAVAKIKEKTVKVKVIQTAVKKNALLVFDTSNSMLFADEKYSTYVGTARNFIKRVNTKANLQGGIVFNSSAKLKSYNSLINDTWTTGAGTNYVDALEMAVNKKDEIDILVFFSDGAPTKETIFGTSGWIKRPYDEYKNKEPWTTILSLVNELKNAGVTIATVDYNSGGGEGLKVMASDKNTSGKYYYNSSNLNTLFEDVFKEVFNTDITVPESYTSSGGIITLENPDRINNIRIDGKNLENYKNYIDEGKLDLNKIPGFKGSETIEIIYQ